MNHVIVGLHSWLNKAAVELMRVRNELGNAYSIKSPNNRLNFGESVVAGYTDPDENGAVKIQIMEDFFSYLKSISPALPGRVYPEKWYIQPTLTFPNLPDTAKAILQGQIEFAKGTLFVTAKKVANGTLTDEGDVLSAAISPRFSSYRLIDGQLLAIMDSYLLDLQSHFRESGNNPDVSWDEIRSTKVDILRGEFFKEEVREPLT